MRRAFVVLASFAASAFACGSLLGSEEDIDAPFRDEARDSAAPSEVDAAGSAGDGAGGSDGAVDANVDAGCKPRTRCADDASVCTFEKTCAPLVGVGGACDASYRCGNTRCDADSGKCIDDPTVFSCRGQGEGCLSSGNCCVGLVCAAVVGGTCELCALAGEGCLNGDGCCSGVCAANGCQ